MESVKLVIYQEAHYDALTYQLSKEQADFTASINYCINERFDLENTQRTVVTILYKDCPSGFFVLDYGEDKHAVTDNEYATLIRSLSVNPSYQGRGIGMLAMQQLPMFVRNTQWDTNELVLSVNFKNSAAYHVYLRAGYVDDGKVISGPMGEQHVLSKMI